MKKSAKVTLETLASHMVKFDERLDKSDGRLDKTDQRLEKFATLMVEGFETLNGKVDALAEDMTQVKKDVSEIKDTLEAHGKAIDKDAVMLINHEKRIVALEPATH